MDSIFNDYDCDADVESDASDRLGKVEDERSPVDYDGPGLVCGIRGAWIA